jgi:dTMP kinase
VTGPATGHRGVFVTLDGLGGAGKSTTARHLGGHLTAHGYSVHTTTEPSRGQLGEIARHGTEVYSGYALACLVAADRYHHIATEIRPQLAAGRIVLCDRYVASSLVLQRMDGVPADFIAALNDAADRPDLAVVLMTDPLIATRRIATRGAHSRFEAGLHTSHAETYLYQDAVRRLTERGFDHLVIDTSSTPVSEVTARIAGRIIGLAGLPPSGSGTA